ncbi:transposase [Paenibacillus brevis]|uniref:transposase n=1 Tax=Paenibacillus brevis TaxID=2841508 RepID=UPI001C124640|nr:transposase [Paenibacillus brevis]
MKPTCADTRIQLEAANVLLKRTAVERVFVYLKEYFGLGRTRHRGVRATVDFQLSMLAYNLSKFALEKLNKQLETTSAQAS